MCVCVCVKRCFKIYLERESMCVSGETEIERERKRESQAGFMLSMEPDSRLDPMTLGS